LAFSPDGQRLASAGDDRTTRVWNASTGEQLLALKGHSLAVLSVCFSPDGRRLATASRDSKDGNVKIWELADQEGSARKIHNAQVRSVVFGPDGKWFASSGIEGGWKISDATNAQEIRVFPHQKNSIYTVALSPDGKRLAGGDGPMVKVWDTATAQEILCFK